MGKRLRCRLGMHTWTQKHTEDNRPYRACVHCGVEDVRGEGRRPGLPEVGAANGRTAGRRGASGSARKSGGVVDGQDDERAVPQHLFDVRPTPTPGGHLDERPAFVRVIDDSRRRWHIGDNGLFQVHDNMRVGPDVVDPVTRAVSAGHTGDEELPVVVVQEDLDAPQLARLPARGRQVDDLALGEGRS